MTKKELSQLYHLNREIEQDKLRLGELEDAATNTAVKITGLPQMVGIADKTALAAEIADIRNIIAAKFQLAMAEFNRLNRYIASVEDSQMRQILTLRYISGLSWRKVAFSMGETDEQYPRKRHNRFLGKSELDEKDETPVLQ